MAPLRWFFAGGEKPHEPPRWLVRRKLVFEFSFFFFFFSARKGRKNEGFQTFIFGRRPKMGDPWTLLAEGQK